MYDLIIAGGGPAGLTAAVYAARAGLSVLVLEITVCGGQIINSQNVENFPSIPSIEGWRLADNWQRQAQSAGAQIITSGVRSVEDLGDIKLVHTAKGDFEGRSLIIAVGAGHRKLDCPGAAELGGRGVSTCAACDGAFFKGREVAVVGGGNTALEDALYLAGICKKVYIVHRRRELRAERRLQDAAAARENIELLVPYVPEKIFADEHGRVAGMEVKNMETGELRGLQTPGVFTAIGMIPNTEPFKGFLELDDMGYVVAGEDCRTGIAGVFAAGDVRVKRLRQLVTAASDGAVAAMAAVDYIISNGWGRT